MTKVYFIDLPNRKKNTASYNRFLHIIELASRNFEVKIFKAANVKSFFNSYRLFRGVILRVNMIICAINIILADKGNSNSVVYVFGIDPILSLIFYIIFHINKIKVLCERNEYPKEIIKNQKYKSIVYNKFVYSWNFKLYDGLIVISEPLKYYYQKYIRNNSFVTIIPICVDFERFENIKSINNISQNSYLFYAGSLDNSKDGIDYLIEAFFYIAKKFEKIQLVIAGNCSLSRRKKIIDYLELNNLTNRVNLLGLIDRNEIPSWLVNSEINILPRPLSKQAQGGFPTKLGEYLAAGKPTIVTKVGDIPKYVNDDEVFYISPNNIVKELITKIMFILNNKEKAKETAIKGKIAANKKFSYQVNKDKIKNAILKL